MNKEPPTLLLEHHLKALKLPTILREYAATAVVCGQERSDYATFLLRLTEKELIDRERRATCHRSLQNAPPRVESKCATVGGG